MLPALRINECRLTRENEEGGFKLGQIERADYLIYFFFLPVSGYLLVRHFFAKTSCHFLTNFTCSLHFIFSFLSANKLVNSSVHPEAFRNLTKLSVL